MEMRKLKNRMVYIKMKAIKMTGENVEGDEEFEGGDEKDDLKRS